MYQSCTKSDIKELKTPVKTRVAIRNILFTICVGRVWTLNCTRKFLIRQKSFNWIIKGYCMLYIPHMKRIIIMPMFLIMKTRFLWNECICNRQFVTEASNKDRGKYFFYVSTIHRFIFMLVFKLLIFDI